VLGVWCSDDPREYHREGVCFRCGKHGHVAAKCVANMPHSIKAKILSAHVAIEDYAFLTDEENVALVTSFSVDDDASSSTIFNSGSVGGVRGKGVQVVSSGRKTRVWSRRKVVCSQPEYVF
jgi:hypothetical protein